MTSENNPAVVATPFESKLLVYVYLTTEAITPYNFASVAGNVVDAYPSELNLRGVETVFNDYRHIRMTFILSPDFDLNTLQSLSSGVKQIISNKTGFVVKTVIEQEV